MRTISAKFIRKLLTSDQNKNWEETCLELKLLLIDNPEFLSEVVTGDET